MKHCPKCNGLLKKTFVQIPIGDSYKYEYRDKCLDSNCDYVAEDTELKKAWSSGEDV